MFNVKISLLALLLLASGTTHGADAPAIVGPSNHVLGTADCKVLDPHPQPHEKMTWNGPCRDGYADGAGTLELVVDGKLSWHFEGMLKRGMPNGDGYISYASGDKYEGGFVDAERSGTGTMVWLDRSRYDGAWKHGEREGAGRMTFSTGGAYEGLWKAGTFHGHGKATYTSGKVVEGEFSAGLPVGKVPLEKIVDPKTYTLTSKRTVGGRMERSAAAEGSLVPFEKTWDALTKQEQRTVREHYDMLDDADEPPYPEKGAIGAYRGFAEAQKRVITEGELRMNVLVDSSGKASTVTVFSSPDPGITQAATFIALAEKYKPALCAGTPCPMIYPYALKFTIK